MSAMYDLTGKKALVTGAGGGLGKAVAVALAQQGADVALWGRNPEKMEDTARIVRELGRKAVIRATDVESVPSLGIAVEETATSLGGLDILVNNAGINHPSPALEVTEADWDHILNINLKGSFFVAQAVVKQMLATARQKGESVCNGRIINISSSLAHSVLPDRVPYLASKGGVNLLTQSLALEWATFGITVNAVGPAIVDTDMTRSMGSSRGVHPKMLFGRLIKPEEIGATVVFLASEQAGMITGQVLYVDAGWSIH